MRVEDAAASGCQLDEHKKIASELAAEEDYNLKSPFFSSSCSSSSALWQRVVLRFIVLSVAIRNLLAGANPMVWAAPCAQLAESWTLALKPGWQQNGT